MTSDCNRDEFAPDRCSVFVKAAAGSAERRWAPLSVELQMQLLDSSGKEITSNGISSHRKLAYQDASQEALV